MIAAREYQDVAARVSRALGAAGPSTLDAALDLALEEVGELTGADVAFVTLVDDDERISDDWQRVYGHPIWFLETFIDPEHFRGTCYRAANWVLLGRTTGRGKQSNSYVPNRSIKEVLGYPLSPEFRDLLGQL